MYCVNCGREIDNNAVICVNCGTNVQRSAAPAPDTGGFGWGALGFFVPIVGLILYLVWRLEKPLTAKSAGVGALVGFGLGILFFIIYFMFMIFMFVNYRTVSY